MIRIALTRLILPSAVLLLSACVSSGPTVPNSSGYSFRYGGPVPPPLTGNEDQAQASRILKLRAEAMFDGGKPVGATAALVQREQYLRGQAYALQRNRDDIWNGLTSMHLAGSDLSGLDDTDSVTRGWIELALLAQQGASLKNYEAWQQTYPNHPGADRLPALMMPGAGPLPLSKPNPQYSAPFTIPAAGDGPVALLLPLSGSLSGAAQMVQKGFTSALRDLQQSQQPQVYDDTGAGDGSGTLNAYQQALSGYAGVIVGPLQKQSVAALAQQGPTQVPVLALNYLPADTKAPAGLLQFGLSPEDEARQAAENAYAHGLRRAVALMPDDDRSSRVLDAFRQRLEQLGGKLLDSSTYPAGTTDFSSLVRGMLGINASMARDQAVANALGRKPEFEPRRRDDVDFIFISGDQTADRLMTSMFRYWRADKLPIYSTADVNSGVGDNDLAGIRFCDSPWKLEPGPEWDAVRARINQARGNQGAGYARLYALGMDAARLSRRLRQGQMLPGEEVVGYTGELSIGSNGVVHRHLACAKVVAGSPPQPLDNPVLPVPGQEAQVNSPTPDMSPQGYETVAPGAAYP